MSSASNIPRIAIMISGRGSNMEVILKKIKEGLLKVKPVVVFSDNPAAEGLEIAKSYGIEAVCFRPKNFINFDEYESEIVKKFESLKVDFIVCAGYMRLLKKTILGAYRNRIINIHPALLPAFPGLKAQEQAFIYGVKITGCTVHFVDEGVDTGPVIMQKEVRIEDNDTLETLTQKIRDAEHDTYWRAIDMVVSGFRVEGRKIKKIL